MMQKFSPAFAAFLKGDYMRHSYAILEAKGMFG
jgi:hypothetical protein